MVDKYDVIIYMRFIRLDVVIPKEFVWEFMKKFGNAFAIEDTHHGMVFQSVEDYTEHPNGWHIKVEVWENHEKKFYEFLRKFCQAKFIKFRYPKDED